MPFCTIFSLLLSQAESLFKPERKQLGKILSQVRYQLGGGILQNETEIR